MLIGGALANALAFIGSSYLFHRLFADNIDAEGKRHDVAIEAQGWTSMYTLVVPSLSMKFIKNSHKNLPI